MSVGKYGASSVAYASRGTDLVWASGTDERNADGDYSTSRTRIHNRRDGTFEVEVIPKAPGEVIGELFIRPLIDKTYDVTMWAFQVVKQTCFLVDSTLSKGLNFLPGAAASPSDDKTIHEECVGQSMTKFREVTEIANEKNDPKMAEAAGIIYDSIFLHCFREVSFNQAKREHSENIAFHKRQKEDYERTFKGCIDGGNNCYCNVVEGQPDMFLVEKTRVHKGQTVSSKEWITTPGYFYWSIHMKRFLKDVNYASGGYNYDSVHSRPIVPTRKDLDGL